MFQQTFLCSFSSSFCIQWCDQIIKILIRSRSKFHISITTANTIIATKLTIRPHHTNTTLENDATHMCLISPYYQTNQNQNDHSGHTESNGMIFDLWVTQIFQLENLKSLNILQNWCIPLCTNRRNNNSICFPLMWTLPDCTLKLHSISHCS